MNFLLSLKRTFPGWDSSIYSEDSSWLVGWEKALLGGKPISKVGVKLNRRAGQLRKKTVPDGDLKAACEIKTFEFLVSLIKCDNQLKDLVPVSA